MNWIHRMVRMEKNQKELRAPWFNNLTGILRYEGFPEIELIFECGRADIEAAAEVMNRHGLGFWAKIFYQFGELREKSFKQESMRAVREGNIDLVHKL